jgi:SAM-dependent methyltransferase
MTTTTAPSASPAAAADDDPFAFAAAFTTWFDASCVLLGIDAGHRAGLFEALARSGPCTVDELAGQGFSARHVQEWLGLMTVGGVVRFDPGSDRYLLPSGAQACLTGDTPFNLAPVAAGTALLAGHVDGVARTLREGGGIPYEAYRPAFTSYMDATTRRRYDADLVDGYVAAVPGLEERLRAGADVLDLGCGSGHVVNLLARAFPRSTFTGYDLAEDALAQAREEAQAWGLTNARFVRQDVAALTAEGCADVVLAVDAVHDQARPLDVLVAARRALRPDGVLVVIDVAMSSHLDQDAGRPLAAFVYGVSLFHCLQVSLAEGGAGLGTAWGVERAERLLAEAGFTSVERFAAPPSDLLNALWACRV